jgi:glycosyltransferase involved in cell wall biosynthesis
MSFVSIIIPVYNSSRFLKRCIESALNQTWKEKEVIIVNDGSSDESLAIAKQFEKQGVIVIDQENKGASAARNQGLALAKGEWIQFLDADDFLREDKIETQLKSLKNEKEIGVCKTVHFIEDDWLNGVPDDDRFYQENLNDPLRFLIKLYGGFDYWSGMIQPNAFLVSRSIIDQAGKWNEELSLDDDGEFFCRVVLQANKIVYSAEAMNFYRKYVANISLSSSKSTKAYESQFKSIRLKHNRLLQYNTYPDLIPHIHTATYKSLQDLKHALYPNHKSLYTEVQEFSKTLIKHPSRGKIVYGGTFANFIGNHISWKFLKLLQNLKSRSIVR